jgi:hypothetical protein
LGKEALHAAATRRFHSSHHPLNSSSVAAIFVFKMNFCPNNAAASSNRLYICQLNNLNVNDGGKVTIRNDDKIVGVGDWQPER